MNQLKIKYYLLQGLQLHWLLNFIAEQSIAMDITDRRM